MTTTDWAHLREAALALRAVAEKEHGCNIGLGIEGEPWRAPCDCYHGRLADEVYQIGRRLAPGPGSPSAGPNDIRRGA